MSNATTAQRSAIGIVRVSRVGDREGDSFASPTIQRSRIEAECERLGIRLIDVHEELDVSGGRPLDQRKGLSAAVAAIESHQANVVMVAYFDRLARSLATQTEVLQRIEDAGGDVMTLDHGTITNGGAAKRLEANIVGAMAQYFREQTAEKTIAAQSAAVARGVMPWPIVPVGYVKGADGVLAPDSATAEHVARAFEMRSEGQTISSIRRHLNACGVAYGYGGVCKMLKNRIYLGEIHFGKLVNPRAHPAIVDRELFDAVQRRVIVKGRLAKSERLLARLGVLRCGSCRRALIVNTSGDGSYPVYRCSPACDCDHHCTISAVIVEQVVSDAVRSALRDAQGRASMAESAQEAVSRLSSAQEGLDAALRVFSLTGAENESGAVERITELRQARDDAQAKVDQIGPEAAKTVNAAADWDELNLAERRELIRATVARATVAPSGRGAERITVNLH